MSKFFSHLFRHLGVWALLTGMVFTLAFAPFFLWPIGLMCLGFLFWLTTHAADWKQAFWSGFLFGLGHHLTGLYWLPQGLYMDMGSLLYAMLMGVPGVIVLASYMALYIGGACALTKRLPAPALLVPFIFAAIWVMGEYVRSFLFTGFPWNLAGAMWANDVQLMQAAAYVQVWGLSFLVVLAGALMVAWRILVLPAVILVALLWVGGWARLEQAGPTKFSDTRVRIVQPNFDEPHYWRLNKRIQLLQSHIDLSIQDAEIPPDIILWPETAVAFFLEQDPYLAQDLSKLLTDRQTLVTGAARKTVDNKPLNGIVTLTSSAEVISTTDKHHLVPYGEYIPFRWMMPGVVEALLHGQQDFIAGPRNRSLALNDNLHAVPLVCYEAIFPWLARRENDTQRVLVNVTNDAWFGTSIGPWQHYALVRLRAVETSLPLLRAANTGVSAVIDGYGREVKMLDVGIAGVIDAQVPMPVDR